MAIEIYTLPLKDNAQLIAEYEAWHRRGKVPKKVIASIRNGGILDMKIYRGKAQLFMVIKTGHAYDPALKAKMDQENEDVRDWEAKMSKYQACSPGDRPDEKWKKIMPIFDLADHKS